MPTINAQTWGVRAGGSATAAEPVRLARRTQVRVKAAAAMERFKVGLAVCEGRPGGSTRGGGKLRALDDDTEAEIERDLVPGEGTIAIGRLARFGRALVRPAAHDHLDFGMTAPVGRELGIADGLDARIVAFPD